MKRILFLIIVFTSSFTSYAASNSFFKDVVVNAEKGEPTFQYLLGYYYYRGENVIQNFQKAFYWLNQSAEQNNKDAQSFLGMMYYKGTYVKTDYKKAAHLFHSAAKQGDAISQYLLGMMYFEGHGIKKDYEKAYMWTLISFHQKNNSKVEKFLNDIKIRVEENKIYKIQDNAQICLDSHYAQCG